MEDAWIKNKIKIIHFSGPDHMISPSENRRYFKCAYSQQLPSYSGRRLDPWNFKQKFATVFQAQLCGAIECCKALDGILNKYIGDKDLEIQAALKALAKPRWDSKPRVKCRNFWSTGYKRWMVKNYCNPTDSVIEDNERADEPTMERGSSTLFCGPNLSWQAIQRWDYQE